MLEKTSEEEYGSLFDQFHVGDYFGEPNIGSENTNYPFTAKAEINHQVEADVIMKEAMMTKNIARMDTVHAERANSFRRKRR